jgi:site-specific DNA recombinase
MKSAIYARVSSDKQKEENTIASQTAALLEFARAHGYSVPDAWIFEDEGYSGASLVRPGLERVRDLAAEGQLCAILVHAPDRLSRKYAYQILLIEEFARHGVETVFVKAPQTATPEDQLLLQFQGMIAEYERAQIVERSRRGKRHRARQGQVSVLSGAPYGYRYVRKSDETAAYYEIIEAEANVVRMVYERYTAEGMSIGAIARLLNEQGVPTRKLRSRWERSTVWGMLRNPAYKGAACFGKTRAAPRQRVTRPLRLRGGIVARNSANHERPRDDWIEIPVPAIIDDATFALAQELLAANKIHAPRRTAEPSVVQGLVSCSKCGYALYRTSTRSSARKIHYYRCLGSDTWRQLGRSVCDNRPVRQDLLDRIVWTEIIRLLEDPSLIETELDRRLAAARASSPTKRREEILQRDLARARKGMDRLLTAYQEDLISLDELRRRMPELRQRERAMQAELRSIVDQASDRAAYLRLAETLSGFLTRLWSSAETLHLQERQRVVRLLVKEILVSDDTIIIRHSIPLPPSPSGAKSPPSQGPEPSVGKGYLLRSERDLAALGEHLPALRLRSLGAALATALGPGSRNRGAVRRRHGGGLPVPCRCAPVPGRAEAAAGGVRVGGAPGQDPDHRVWAVRP